MSIPLHQDDELLDLVDEADHVIGTINRKNYSEIMEKNLGYIRASDVFIVNSLGKVLVPIRLPHKTIAPNGFDYSAGGHVARGDDYQKTAIKETLEELGVNIEPNDLILLGKFTEKDVRYIRSLYVVIKDIQPTINPNDFSSAKWLDPTEALQLVRNGHPSKLRYDHSLEVLIDYLEKTNA